MPMTFVQTVTVGVGGASSITFSSIPQTGKDLVIFLSLRGTSLSAGDAISHNINGSGSAQMWLTANGSSASALALSNSTQLTTFDTIPAASSTSNTFSNGCLYISQYTSTNRKSGSLNIAGENNSTAGQQVNSLASNSSDPVTSIVFTANSGNFAQHSTASLYIVS